MNGRRRSIETLSGRGRDIGLQAALLVVLLALAVPPALAAAPARGTAAAHGAEPPAVPAVVRGHVVLGVGGARLADAGPVVVYLDALEGDLDYQVPAAVPKISQKDATFSPAFLVVTRGQTVQMPNDDTIFHNSFSYSKPNEFDLGLYRRGESKLVTFRHAGVVRIYCSIHESMNAVIFVAPSPYHTVASAEGTFEIHGVPPGKYQLKTWNKMLPEAVREVNVPQGRDADLEVVIAGSQ